MQHKQNKFVKKVLLNKLRSQRWRNIILCLSFVVVFCTVFALIHPAITLDDNTQVHVHNDDCYTSKGEFICKVEDETSEQAAADRTETESNSTQIDNDTTVVTNYSDSIDESSLVHPDNAYSLQQENIVSVKLTYKENGKDTEITNGTVSKPDSKYLKVSVSFKDISAIDLKTKYNRTITYELPAFFRSVNQTSRDILNENNQKIGTIQIIDHKAVITYDEDFLDGFSDGIFLSGDFFVEGEIKLEQLNSNNGQVNFETPNGNIILDYGIDYMEQYGNVSVNKQCSKPNQNSDYLRYTITVTADKDGCDNVYVVDQFTSNNDLVSYVEISETETILNTAENGYQPFESANSSSGKIQLVNDQLIWTIGNLGSNETRTLTYYVKINDQGKLSTNNNQTIINTASAHTKGSENHIYDKGSANAEFTPYTKYTMSKNVVKQNNTDFIKDTDGNYIIQYRLNFSLNNNSNYPFKKFTFADYLNYGDAFSTDRKMLSYVSYERSSIAIYRTSDNALLSSNDYVVTWSKDNKSYKENWSSEDGNPTGFEVTLNNPVNPGESYYVTYQLIVKPEVYAVMQANSVSINNRYLIFAENVNGSNMINRVYSKLALNEYKWLEKSMDQNAVAEDQSITMNEPRYVYQNGILVQDDKDTQFTVSAGSYKYTVIANQTLGQWDVTDSTMTDTLQPEQMRYVGYLKVTEFDPISKKDIDCRWVKIDGNSSFAFQLSQIGWKNNNDAYRFEYYAYPSGLDTVNQIKVNNTFSMNQAKRNNTIFQFDRLNVSHESTLNGFYNLNIQKKAWYYELPVENASTWKNGKHYWVIEIQGSAIRDGMQIKDQISSDNGIVDSYLHSDSLVGIYQGNLLFDQYNHIEELNQAGLVNQKDLFTSQFENNKNYKNQDCFSELILTAKQNIQLGENNNLYIVICTEPASIPSQYRAVSTYKNEVYLKDFNETTFEKQADASQELYGGGDILKELGQTFEYDGSTITNILPGADNGNTSKICTELLPSNGVFASWAFKVNYAGQMRGDYRILEDIPSGMELSYIRIKWHGGKTAQIQSKKIDGLDGWTSYTNTTTNDNRESQTTTYYVKGNQALIQLGTFIDGHERDNYSVDVQVVCRVNDPDVLLGGKSKTFENKVTLQTSDVSENLVSATSNATVNKNSLDKEHVTDRQKINYSITVNPLSQKLPTNIQDDQHLTIVDKIGSNLELNADSIIAKDKDGNPVSITKSFDAQTNTLEITVPNEMKVLIYYSVNVKTGPSIPVTLTNNVYWKNYSHSSGKNDVIENYTYTLNAGGTTTSTEKPKLTVEKWDQDTMQPLANVKFEVQQCELDENEIKTNSSAKTDTTSEDGTLLFSGMEFNTIYKVTETSVPDGYMKDTDAHYIMCVNERANNYSEAYIQSCEQNGNIKIVYDIPSFKLQIYNAQKGIIVQKAFVNDAAGTSHLPMSGTYWFALYDNPEGTGQPLEKVSITYQPNDTDVKSAKFKNNDLLNTYYVFELDQNGNPIVTSDQEVSINHLLYCVEYKNGESYTNAAKVGETVTVTNYSRYKKLPSTGGNGTGRYMIAGSICILLAGMLMILLASKQTKD